MQQQIIEILQGKRKELNLSIADQNCFVYPNYEDIKKIRKRNEEINNSFSPQEKFKMSKRWRMDPKQVPEDVKTVKRIEGLKNIPNYIIEQFSYNDKEIMRRSAQELHNKNKKGKEDDNNYNSSK